MVLKTKLRTENNAQNNEFLPQNNAVFATRRSQETVLYNI
jgi:hypothetical protein